MPIAVTGIAAAHAAANAAFGSPEGPGEVFASAASGAELLPLLSAFTVALALLGLGGRIAGIWWVPRHARSVAVPFACLPPVAFVLLELAEALLHRGSIPSASLLEPTFLLGLVLQFPFAFAGYVAARLLLRLSDRVGRLVARVPAAAPFALLRILPRRPGDEASRSLRTGSPSLGRAPPLAPLSG